MTGIPITYKWQWKLKSTPIELWPLIADIQRIHQTMKLLTTETSSNSGSGAAKPLFKGTPIPEQSSTCWIQNHRLKSTLTYRSGPITQVTCEITLKKGKTGTELFHNIQIYPNGIIGRIMVPFLFGRTVQQSLSRLYQEIDLSLQGKKEGSFAPNASKISPKKQIQLKKFAEQCIENGFQKSTLRFFVRSLTYDSDSSLAMIRPRVLAHTWGVHSKKLCELFTLAIKNQILQPLWQFSCPRCNRWKISKTTFEEISAKILCEFCNEEFIVDLSSNVELGFQPHPSLRRLKINPSHLQSPTQKPQTLIQQYLQPGKQLSEPLQVNPGSYLVYTDNSSSYEFHLPEGPQGEIFIEVDEETITCLHKPESEETLVRMVNKTKNKQLLYFEEASWKEKCISGTRASTCVHFRKNLDDGSAAPQEPMNISEVTFLITSIIKSTSLYLQKGDRKAYQLLEEASSLQEKLLDQHDGAIVQQMGDTMIAAFTSPANALKASLVIRDQFRTFNATLPQAEQIATRMGLHRGSCLAYRMNRFIGFFGLNVNIAHIVSESSSDNTIAMSKELYEDEGVKKVIDLYSDQVEVQQKEQEFSEQFVEIYEVTEKKEEAPKPDYFATQIP